MIERQNNGQSDMIDIDDGRWRNQSTTRHEIYKTDGRRERERENMMDYKKL